MKAILMLLSFLLPWQLRRSFLEKQFGFQIHPTARIGLAWVFPTRLIMEEGSAIGTATVCKNIDLLHLKACATIGRGNWITGFPLNGSRHFAHQTDRRPELILGEHSAITNRHLLDCTNLVMIGRFTTFAGFHSQIISHSIDLEQNRQSSKPVRVGDYCFVGTNCVLLGGSNLPDFCILGAKSLLNKAFTDPYQLYGGVPARPLKALSHGCKYFSGRKVSLSSPLKILQLVHTLDPSAGGVASAVLALSRGLAKRGHKVEVIALDDPSAGWIRNLDLTVHALGVGVTSYRYSGALMPWLREHGDDYDRVIVNGMWQYLSFATWRRYSRSSIPYYIFPHGMLDPWFKRTFPLKHLKKWLYWPWAEYRVLRAAAAVIFTSEEERLQTRKSFWLYRAREKVSPLGVEAVSPPPNARSEFLARYPQLQHTRNLLFLGRLHPKKGCDILLDAFARISSRGSISLVLAGPDQLGWEASLRRQVARLNLTDRIVFTGMLRGEWKQGAFAAADAFVLPSHQENFGISVVEALAASVPVLISNRVNIWREVEGDRAGYIDSDDLEGTTRLLQRWIETPATEDERMRQNARRCFEQRFEINRAVDSLLQILSASRTDSSWSDNEPRIAQ